MLNGINFNTNYNKNITFKADTPLKQDSFASKKQNAKAVTSSPILPSIRTTLSQDEQFKYLFLLNMLKDLPKSENAQDLTPAKQLETLLKNGKLLSRSNDNTTALDNLYSMASEERAYNLSPQNLITNTLDILVNPKIITQEFGDIPQAEKQKIISYLPKNHPARLNPDLLNVQASGTCAAASNEVNLADKYPAEFARWVNHLSGKEKSLYLNTKLSSISSNKLDAITILKLLKANTKDFNFDSVKIKVETDPYAYARAYIQDKYWNKGERNVADVLVQSAIMQLGSQNTYDSLTDMRGGEFNSNPQGLVEIEKTYVESLIKNEEITSLVYQKIDENQNLIGYSCSFEKMQKHILDALDSRNNVIVGYILTNETSGRNTLEGYNPAVDGASNKVINGHEITIVDYKKDENGKVTFICIDTDDDSSEFVEYSADWLLPKIHHAGYVSAQVKDDEEAILKEASVI